MQSRVVARRYAGMLALGRGGVSALESFELKGRVVQGSRGVGGPGKE